MLRSVHRVAAVILVDSSGRLLLQLRDGGTTKDPHRWGPPGGRVEPGEEPYEAAVRELEEETGLRVDRLDLFWSGLMPWGTEVHFYCGATTARPHEVECNEGAAMEFVDAALISDLDLTRSFSMIFRRFLDSPQYAALCL
jgi:8-oxo-dGTP pyrophosphatase MutT (NUDIX family)